MSTFRRRGLLTAIACAVALVAGFFTVSTASADGTDAVTPQAELVIPHEYQVQETGYWCSAAAARIALTARGAYVSQSELASYMNVSPDIGLPSIANLRDAMNTYTGTGYYELKQWSSESELLDRLTADVFYNVDRGHTVIINVTRIADAHFPGGHYATIVGYRNGGAQFLIADPANSSRAGIWLDAWDVADGVKLYRYVA